MALRVNSYADEDSLGRDLRAAREAVDLSQVELAARFGVAPRTIQYWEAGKEPRPSHRRAIRAFIRFVNCEEAA